MPQHLKFFRNWIYPRHGVSLWQIPIVVASTILLVGFLYGGAYLFTQAFGDEGNADVSQYWIVMSTGVVFLSFLISIILTYSLFTYQQRCFRIQQSNFLDSISHELKTPIASLKLSLQTIARYNVSVQVEKSFYTRMEEDVERLDRLINQVLRASQLETGKKIDGVAQTFCLKDYLKEVIDPLRLHYQLPSQRVEIFCPDDLVVTLPKFPVEIILRNLVDNAIKYSGENPVVKVIARCCNEKNDVAIRVSDNGPGIPISRRKKIFKRFQRFGSELERKQKGTGLGLYLVKKCVTQIHGTIDVQGNQTGESGTSFLVIIPQSPHDTVASEKKEDTEYR